MTHYIYQGTFQTDIKKSTPRYIYRRKINDFIDLENWYKNLNFNYLQYDDEIRAFDALKNIYLNHNFKYHMAQVSKFNSEYNDICKERISWEKLQAQFVSISNIVNVESIDNKADLDNILDLLCNVLKSAFNLDISISDLYLPGFSYIDIKKELVRLKDLSNTDISYNDRIHGSKYDYELACKISSLFHKESFLYTLSDELTTYFIKKLKISLDKNDSLNEKHCKLYFWKSCNIEMRNWSSIKFYRFLLFLFGNPYEKTKKEYALFPKPQEDLIDLYEEEEYEEQKYLDILGDEDTPQTFTYDNKPQIKKTTTQKGREIIVTDPKKKINAFVHAGYKCEINPNHKSFISRVSGKPYMEGHHLIKKEYSDYFEYSIDVEQNIICLCSSCHREIHHGENAAKLVGILYQKRKEVLKQKGFDISLEQLLDMYR